MDENSTPVASDRVARVVAEHKSNCVIRTSTAEYTATVRGSFHVDKDFPKVGDYVEYVETSGGQAVIERILPRRTQIVRDATERRTKTGVQKQQIIVTNVDIIFIVMGLDGDFSPKRLERYLLLAQESNTRPVVILNKADVAKDVTGFLSQASSVAGRVPIHVVSAEMGTGMDALRVYMHPDTTAVLLGSSGAGKSTITNWFLGEAIQTTQEVRHDDGRGKHTTTGRELFALPHGGFLIDTPGMRELGMVAGGVDDVDAFAEIRSIAAECKYPNCDHEKSEGCAIREALENGRIDALHFRSYQKLQREQKYNLTKTDHASYVEHKQKVKRRHKEYNKILKEKHQDDEPLFDV